MTPSFFQDPSEVGEALKDLGTVWVARAELLQPGCTTESPGEVLKAQILGPLQCLLIRTAGAECICLAYFLWLPYVAKPEPMNSLETGVWSG